MISWRQVGLYMLIINLVALIDALLGLAPTVAGSLAGIVFGIVLIAATYLKGE